MHNNSFKIFLNSLLIFACVYFQSCKDQDPITPQPKDEAIAVDALKKIKSLGFTDDQIVEKPNYFLADGDLYFSKIATDNTTTPAKREKKIVVGDYGIITIHLDESLESNIDEHWRTGIHQAISAWNAKEDVNFHFELTNAATADINIIKDTDLPKDLAIASEFPKNGRTGSRIRINVATTKVVEDPKRAFAHALEHCVGFLHSSSLKNKTVATSSKAATNARGPRFSSELYIIQGDILRRVDASTGEWYVLSKGWTGTEVMGQIDGMLYMVQFGTLYAVNPSSGKRYPLTDGWAGSQYITKITGGKLYILQDSWIWPVDPETGMWDADLGSYKLARGLVGFVDPEDGKNKLAVLKRKVGSTTVSLLYVINPSNGAVLSTTTIPASKVEGWNGTFMLVKAIYLQVFNGTLNWIGGGAVTYSYDEWPDAELAAASGNSIYVINDGSLYRVQPEGMYSVKRIGGQGDWVDSSLMVFLNQ